MIKTRVELEKDIVLKMIDIYYKKNGTLEEKVELKAYATKRLIHCKFGNDKSFCSHCKIHCYAPKYKEQIKKVMKYSGPRIVFKHPIMVIRHIIKK